jgi:hypothetical protein
VLAELGLWDQLLDSLGLSGYLLVLLRLCSGRWIEFRALVLMVASVSLVGLCDNLELHVTLGSRLEMLMGFAYQPGPMTSFMTKLLGGGFIATAVLLLLLHAQESEHPSARGWARVLLAMTVVLLVWNASLELLALIVPTGLHAPLSAVEELGELLILVSTAGWPEVRERMPVRPLLANRPA